MSAARCTQDVIVSITPCSLGADSRTFKTAASLGRFGFRSIVVEGIPSRFHGASLPFELKTVRQSGLLSRERHIDETGLWGNRLFGESGARRMMRAPATLARLLRRYLDLYLWSTYRALPPAKLYYLHAFYQFPAVYLRCWRHRARYIYDAHDFYAQLDDEESLSSFWRHWILPFERRMELACVNRAAAVVTVNGGIADLIKNRFGCDVLVLRNSHDRRLDLPVQQTIRDVIGLGKRDFLIVSIGNWKPGMAMEEAFLALEALPPRVHLAFLGGGYPDYQARLATGGLAERVHILDPVDPACVVPFIKTADAGIILYYAKSIDYHHSLPNRFFQSVAGGLPLLYPMLNEIARLCEQHDLGIAIDPQEPQSIVSAIQKLIDSPQTAASLKRNAANAMDELSWERDEKVLQELIRQQMNASPSLARAGTQNRISS